MTFLLGKDLGNGLVLQLGVSGKGRLVQAFGNQPFVQFREGGEAAALGEKAFPDHPHLILHLPLLPAGAGAAGHRIKQVVGRQVLEPPVEDPVLAQQDLADHGLQVVVDPPGADPTKKREGPDMGIEHHLHGLPGIGDAEELAAMAETELRDLHRRRYTRQLDLFVAPVELEGIAWIKFQRNVGLGQEHAVFPPPTPDIATDRVIAAPIPLALQLLKQQLPAAPMGNRLVEVFRQQFAQPANESAELWLRLLSPLILMLGDLVADDIPDSVAGNVQLPAYLADSLAIPKMRLPDLAYGFHVQHLLLAPPSG